MKQKIIFKNKVCETAFRFKVFMRHTVNAAFETWQTYGCIIICDIQPS